MENLADGATTSASMSPEATRRVDGRAAEAQSGFASGDGDIGGIS